MQESFRTVYNENMSGRHRIPKVYVMGYRFKRRHYADVPGGSNSWFFNLFHTPVQLLTSEGIIECPKNTFLIYAPDEPIYYGSEKEWIHSWIRLGGKETDNIVQSSGIKTSTLYSLEDDAESLYWLKAIDSLMRHECIPDHTGVRRITELWLHRVMLLNAKEKTVAMPGNIAATVRYIESNFTKHIVLENLAEKAFISRSQLCRLFRKHTGTSPLDYAMQCRINYAREMLQTSRLSITEISAECGFYDIYHFSKIFKKKTGIPPATFRRKTQQ